MIQTNIQDYIGKNIAFNLFLFFLFTIFWIILLGFGSPILILSGILFGTMGWNFYFNYFNFNWSFIIVHNWKFFFKDLVNFILKNKFEKYIERFQKNEFYYFLAFRFAGGLGIPFGLQNVLPVIFNIKNSNYFFASFFGLMPHFFIWNTVGSGINNFIRGSESFNLINLIMSKEIYIPIIIFLILILISLIIKKLFFK